MNPAGLVAEDQATIDERRRSPDRCLRFIFPNDFALVGRQAIQVTVARTDVYSAIRDDRARPHATLLFQRSTSRLVLPKQHAVALPETIDHAILSGCVDFAFVNRRRRI